MHIDTKCIQAGWQPGNGEPRALPIVQSTTFTYDSAAYLGDLFDLKAAGHFYTRLSNPTTAAAEDKINALEGGVGAMCTSSGQAATMTAVLNIAQAGDNIISLSAIYGGTLNLLAVTLKKMGIEVRFVTQEMSDEEILACFDENTKLVFGETIANPALEVLDLERFAALAHQNRVPLVIDNTFATPIFCRPFAYGADIVIHSTTKYMDGHATVVGGAVVDSGNFDWEASGKFPMLTEPDDSYHGLIYTQSFGKAAYITKARTQLMRDMGLTPSPMSAFLLHHNLETLHLRMPRHYENALAVARMLAAHEKVSFVSFPKLEGDAQYALAEKYLPNGCSGVISFGVKGGRAAAAAFMEALTLASLEIHVADSHTCVLHPASTTHRQLTDEQLVAAGIGPDMIRLSVGLEHIDDILADICQALDAVEA